MSSSEPPDGRAQAHLAEREAWIRALDASLTTQRDQLAERGARCDVRCSLQTRPCAACSSSSVPSSAGPVSPPRAACCQPQRLWPRRGVIWWTSMYRPSRCHGLPRLPRLRFPYFRPKLRRSQSTSLRLCRCPPRAQCRRWLRSQQTLPSLAGLSYCSPMAQRRRSCTARRCGDKVSPLIAGRRASDCIRPRGLAAGHSGTAETSCKAGRGNSAFAIGLGL